MRTAKNFAMQEVTIQTTGQVDCFHFPHLKDV